MPATANELRVEIRPIPRDAPAIAQHCVRAQANGERRSYLPTRFHFPGGLCAHAPRAQICGGSAGTDYSGAVSNLR